MLRRLLLLFAALLAVLAGTPAHARAHTTPSAQNCARASLSAAHTHARTVADENACTRPGSTLGSAKIAAGCCVATKGGANGLRPIAGGAPGAGGRAGKLSPNDDALGPHTVFRRGQDGRIDKYTTFDELGREVLRFRGSGGSHAGLDPPLFYGAKPGKGPGAPLNRARNPGSDDYQNLPPGY